MWAWYPCAILGVAHVSLWWALAGASFWWASVKLLSRFSWCGLWVGFESFLSVLYAIFLLILLAVGIWWALGGLLVRFAFHCPFC